LRERKKELEEDHKHYQQQSGVFKKFEGLETDIEKLSKRIDGITGDVNTCKKNIEDLRFDPESLKQAREELAKARAEQSKLTERMLGSKKEQAQKEEMVRKQREALTNVRVLELDIENKRQFRLFVNFIRDTIRAAGPLVGTEMVASIGRTASEFYCEILSDHSQQLNWTREYDIEIASPEGTKVFKQLSGGEQMSGALALRLALLRHLAHSDIVFLDEPTQNLDDERRSNLAMQISKVTGFSQMFIITHDDTFSQDYEYVIKVFKDHGVSGVSYQ
jgi:exonuclease SbcC